MRQRYAEGKASRDELLEAEAASYHAPGTCTFYGTANSNQMLMEVMGLHLPGTAFVNPGTPLRDALTVPRPNRRCASPRSAATTTPLAAHRRREGDRQRHGRAGRDRRLDQPRDPPGRDRARRRRLLIDWDDLDELSPGARC